MRHQCDHWQVASRSSDLSQIVSRSAIATHNDSVTGGSTNAPTAEFNAPKAVLQAVSITFRSPSQRWPGDACKPVGYTKIALVSRKTSLHQLVCQAQHRPAGQLSALLVKQQIHQSISVVQTIKRSPAPARPCLEGDCVTKHNVSLMCHLLTCA